jgi:hypothetical protein
MGRRQPAESGPPDVRPLDVDGVRTVAIVTVFWGVAFVLLAFRQGALNDAGRGWWMWTCLAGVGLGLLGLEYCRKRRDAIARAALEAEAEAPDDADDWSGVGDWSKLPDEPDDEFRYDTDPQNVSLPTAAGELAGQAVDDQRTVPYSPVGHPPPGPSTGEMPAGPVTGEQQLLPAAGLPLGPAPSAPDPSARPAPPPLAPAHRPPAQQRPAAQAGPPPAPARPAPPPVVPQRPAQRPAIQHAPPPQQPPANEPPRQPEHRPATGELDPYSTGSLHAAPAGYTPEPERRHPRDREYSARTGELPAAPPPAASQRYEPLADEDPPDPGRPSQRSKPTADPTRPLPSPPGKPASSRPSQRTEDSEFSEFFADPPSRSGPDNDSADDDSDFLLGDPGGDAGDGRRTRRAADDDVEEPRGRRSRRSS